MSETAFNQYYRYRLSGLNVLSEVALPARTPLDREAPAATDVTIRPGEVPQRIENARHQGGVWSADESRFLLTLPGIGAFMAEDGCRVTLAPAGGVAVDDILVFATGTVLSAILYQRGALLLHAAAVADRGRAFVFCGPSGAGKSTLAAALCSDGCDLLADDLCALDQSVDGAPAVQSDGPALRLYPDSIAHVGLDHSVGPKVRRSVDKFHVFPPTETGVADRSVRLAGVYLLADANPASPSGIVRLSPLAGAHGLMQQSYRRRLALAYAKRGQPAARMASLLSNVPVYRLNRPRDFSKLDATVARLRAHWNGPG